MFTTDSEHLSVNLWEVSRTVSAVLGVECLSDAGFKLLNNPDPLFTDYFVL